MNEPDDPKLFENQLPALLEEELAIAQRLGVHPSRVGTDEFDQAINQGTIKERLNGLFLGMEIYQSFQNLSKVKKFHIQF